MKESEKKRIRSIVEELKNLYPIVECTLNYNNELELLVATQLAAQCTDQRVNEVTPKLFARYSDVHSFAEANLSELEELIRPTGFFRNKAKNIKECCIMLINEYGGEVPDDMNKLIKLPGVGRKTANVVLGTIFNIPGIIVDTHAKRLSNRLGLSKNTEPEKVEKDLEKIIQKNQWIDFSHRLVSHGRAICDARKPKCSECTLNQYCVFENRRLK